MKKILVFLLTAVFLLSIAVGASAYPMSSRPARLDDGADLLTDAEEAELTGLLDQISEEWQTDVIVATAESIGGRYIESYADDYYDANGFGFGENADGILLLIVMEDSDWALSTCGRAIDVFTDDRQAAMSSQFLPYLSGGEYLKAFRTYAAYCETYLKLGLPEDSWEDDPQSDTREEWSSKDYLKWIPIALAIGLVIGLIVTASLKKQLKSVRMNNAAGSYVRGGLNLTTATDLFLYRKVDRIEIPRDDYHGSGGHHGGSSVHMSSSGRSHGGSHGHF